MKKKVYYIAIVLTGLLLTLSGCQEDELSKTSVIVNQTDLVKQNAFDQWLNANYVEPYNIQFKYRYEDKESDANYFTVPAKFEDAIIMAKLIKYLCIEAYNEVAGPMFTKTYFPKMIYCIGEWEYRNNGTILLGTAESGKKILMTGANKIKGYLNNPESINEFYLKTIHHEFTHILNQTKDFSAAFKLITPTLYVADSWSDSPYSDNGYCLTHGFITAYAQHSDTEDFAEMLSTYVTTSKAKWQEQMNKAGAEGARLIEAKLDNVRSYLKKSFNIDIDELRDAVQRRQQDLVEGKVNVTDFS